MPIRKKRPNVAQDAILTGDVPDTLEPGLAALLEDPISAGGTPSGLPKLRPAPPFLLRHWPLNWEIAEVEGAAVWLPEVSPHLLVKGAAGIRTPAPHEPESNAYADAVLAARRLGWVYLPLSAEIPAKLLPPGVPAGRYRRRVRGVHPITKALAETWVTAWDVPQPGLASQPLRFTMHRESWDKWRAALVAAGTLAAPTEVAKAQVRQTLDRHLSRTLSSRMDKEQRAAKAEGLKHRIALVEAAA
tara:strand:+ start:697 stop:1431 length:735 start_codon:yes stop_codon:yes gene_type:complete